MFKNSKKTILLALMISNISNLTFASGTPTLKLEGGYEFQSIFYDNNAQDDSLKYVSGNRKNFGFNSSGHINVEAQNVVENLLEYGAKMSLETTFYNDRRIAASVFGITDYGKFEAGSDKSANSKMRITGYSAACATAGAWDIWPKFPKYISYATSFSNFLDSKTRTSPKVEYSRKISYFTPKLNGFQIGVSYIPDTTNVGYQAADKAEYHQLSKPFPYKFAINDGIAYGITYEYTANEDFKISTAFVGERGKIKKVVDSDGNPIDKAQYKFKNLSTYTIGTLADYKQVSVAASYGNYMKSFTSPVLDTISRDTSLYSVGTRYKFNDQIASSLNYFHSNYKKSAIDATTLAVNYLVTKGLLCYGELTYYTTKGKYLSNSSVKGDNTNGKIAIIGTKLEF